MKFSYKHTRRSVAHVAPRNIALMAALGLGGAMLSGCGNKDSGQTSQGSAPTGSASANELVIVSPHGREIQSEFESLFKAKHPEVTFKWYDQGGTSDLLRLVMGQAGNKPGAGLNGDLFFGGGPETFLVLEEKGLLQPLPEDYGIPAKLNGVPLRSEANNWVAAALSGFGILVNQSYATRDNLPIPKVWSDLGNPKLIDRVEMADPRQSGSAHTAYEVILQTNGWEKGWKTLEGMAANSRRFLDSSSLLLNDVSSGEAVMAPAIDFYGRKSVAKAGKDSNGKDKLLYVEPKGQSIVTPDPIGLLKGAPHADLAKEFVKVVLSPEGQKLWMLKKGVPGGPTMKEHSDEDGLYRMAAIPSAYKPIPKDSLIQSDPYKTVNQRPYDAAKGAQRRQAMDALLGAVLIDNQTQLKAAWKKNSNFSYVPITEAELAEVAKKWDDAAFRNKTTDEWLSAAKKAYQG